MVPADPWGVYCRISKARDGSMLGVERQEPPTRALVENLGGQVVHVYIDNDLSAFSGQRRPEFEAMLTDLRDGRIKGVAAWQADRLVRRVRDAIPLLDTIEAVGGRLATVGGQYDLGTAAGRFNFRNLANMSEFESDLKRERLQAKHEELARTGRWHGGRRPFGFAANGVDHDPIEAELIREAARRLVGCETVGTILRDWKLRGITTASGKEWAASNFRTMLCSPRLAGLRVHKGEVIGEAAWAPILDRAIWQRVCIIFADRQGRRRQGRGRVYLLTGGLAVCGYSDCGRSLSAGARSGRPCYRCRAEPPYNGCGRIVVGKELLENEVTGRVIAALAGPKLVELRRRAAEGDEEAERLAAAMREAEMDLEHLAGMHGRGEIKAPEWRAARGPILDRIEVATRALARRPKMAALTDLPHTQAELKRAWSRWSIDKKRSVLGSVIEAVIVLPVRHGGRFDPHRVRCRWLV
jgi:site-specific DNA recombinase